MRGKLAATRLVQNFQCFARRRAACCVMGEAHSSCGSGFMLRKTNKSKRKVNSLLLSWCT